MASVCGIRIAAETRFILRLLARVDLLFSRLVPEVQSRAPRYFTSFYRKIIALGIRIYQ